MPSESIIIICAAFTGTGAIIDRLLRRSDKHAIHDALTDIWFQLADYKIAQFPSLVASRMLQLQQRVLGHHLLSIRAIITGLLISVPLTLFAISAGAKVEGWPEPFGDLFLRLLSFPKMWTVTVPVNFAFDFLTIAAAVFVLNQIAHANPWKSISLIFAMLLIAFVLAIATQVTADLIDNAHPAGTTLADRVGIATYSLKMLYLGAPEVPPSRHADASYASTSFLPVACIAAILVFLYASKLVLACAMFLLERVTENDPKDAPDKFIPFTLVGLVFSLISLSAKTIGHFAP